MLVIEYDEEWEEYRSDIQKRGCAKAMIIVTEFSRRSARFNIMPSLLYLDPRNPYSPTHLFYMLLNYVAQDKYVHSDHIPVSLSPPDFGHMVSFRNYGPLLVIDYITAPGI